LKGKLRSDSGGGGMNKILSLRDLSWERLHFKVSEMNDLTEKGNGGQTI